MIHIVFNTADIEILKQALELETSLQGEVVEIKDDFAVGPLAGIDTEEGWNARVEWWRGLLKDTTYGEKTAGSFDDRETVKQLQQALAEKPLEEVWIWMGQNQHDVCGYYWLMSQLRDFQGRVSVLYLNNLPFINEKGQLFYPSWISEILPKEAVKARRLARPITLSEFEVDPDEWRKLVDENALVRMLEGGKKLVSKGDDFYDAEIMKNITTEWQKSWRVLSNTLNRMKIKTGDVFLLWRIRNLIEAGRIVINGDLTKGWKDVELKVPEVKQLEITD